MIVPVVGVTVNRGLEIVTLLIIRSDVPVLVIVTESILVVPLRTLPKLIFVGVAENNGETPVPLTVMVLLLITVLAEPAKVIAVAVPLTPPLAMFNVFRSKNEPSPLSEIPVDFMTPEFVVTLMVQFEILPAPVITTP